MTTTVISLVERLNDTLGNYGDGSTTVSLGIASNVTSLTVASEDGITAGTWLMIGYEMVYVSAVSGGPPVRLTIRRGQRRTTAATIATGDVVWINPKRSNQAILNALNGALSRLHKTVTGTTYTIVDSDFDYAKETTIDNLLRVEIETSADDGQYAITRNWEMIDKSYFRIYGGWTAGLTIKQIGTSKFTVMAAGGNLEADFPDGEPSATEYLYYDALGHLLLDRQAVIADRDSFQGITDAFAANVPDFSVRTARFYLAEAERFKREAIAKCPILQTPEAPVQSPTRRYLAEL